MRKNNKCPLETKLKIGTKEKQPWKLFEKTQLKIYIEEQ